MNNSIIESNTTNKGKILVVCTTDSMIWNFLIIHIKELQKRGYVVECACSRTGFFFDELVNKHGFVLHEIQVHRSPFSFHNIKALRELNKILKEGNFNNVFCHEPMGGVLGRIAGKKCNCTVNYMAHGFHFYKGAPLVNRIIYYTVERILSCITDNLMVINNEDYEAALKFHAKNVIKTHGIGIDTQKFKKDISFNDLLNKECGLNDSIFKVLTVGEMIARKNHEVLIKSFALLPDNVHLFIAGSGELEGFLKKLAKELNVEKNVHFLGFRKDVKHLCSSADLFVFPSFQEGLSVALMEAMGCGLPVVASNIRGNNDLIVNGKGGVLVDKNEPQKYMEAILGYFNNPIDCTKSGTFNKEYVKKFDIDIVVDELKQIYP